MDFPVSHASQSEEWLIKETAVDPVSFLLDEFLEEGKCQFAVFPCILEVWGRMGLKSVKIWLDSVSTIVWAAPGGLELLHSGRGDTERKAEEKHKCGRGTREDAVQQSLFRSREAELHMGPARETQI